MPFSVPQGAPHVDFTCGAFDIPASRARLFPVGPCFSWAASGTTPPPAPPDLKLDYPPTRSRCRFLVGPDFTSGRLWHNEPPNAHQSKTLQLRNGTTLPHDELSIGFRLVRHIERHRTRLRALRIFITGCPTRRCYVWGFSYPIRAAPHRCCGRNNFDAGA